MKAFPESTERCFQSQKAPGAPQAELELGALKDIVKTKSSLGSQAQPRDKTKIRKTQDMQDESHSHIVRARSLQRYNQSWTLQGHSQEPSKKQDQDPSKTEPGVLRGAVSSRKPHILQRSQEYLGRKNQCPRKYCPIQETLQD